MAISEQAQSTELLRLVTCGSVDDGKSTLIGRLLYDTKQIFVDQLEHIEDVSRRRGHGYVDLALLTDGLRAEREQGITIDVAYRSFVTPRRRFQLADAPGHVQYTRNMVTGASTAELGIVLVDARQGVVEQTRRHAYILSILRVPHAVVAVNKMDLVDWSQERFDEIAAQLEELGLPDLVVIPISALQGDNVVDRSENMPWYDGPLLLEHLETVEIASDRDLDSRRFPVQWVIRPRSDEHHDYRGYGGQVAGGVWSAGDDVVVLPAGLKTQVEAVETIDGPLEAAIPPMSVTIRLTDDLDVSRGDMLADPADPPTVARELQARVCWMSERPLEPRARLAVKQTTRSVRAIADELVSRIDVHTLEDVAAPGAARAERHRRRAPPALRAAVRRSLRGEPHDRRVRADRRGDERDRRRRDGPLGVMTWQFTLTGLGLGLIVGLTGVGGGSLMTPILIILFGFKPTYAVGTDIFHGAIFKSFGAVRHRRLGTVHAHLAFWLFLGSGPLAIAGVVTSYKLQNSIANAETILGYAIGVALIGGGAGFLAKSFVKRGVQPSAAPFIMSRRDKLIALGTGAVFGFIVGLTSVGSGTYFGLMMVLVYPLTMPRIVGTDIFHAAALLWVAGVGHLIIGDVDLHATAWLLSGSVPGILISSRYTVTLPDMTIRCGLGGILIISGIKLLNTPGGNWILGGGLGLLFVVLTIYTVSVMRSQQPRTAPEQPRTTPERA